MLARRGRSGRCCGALLLRQVNGGHGQGCADAVAAGVLVDNAMFDRIAGLGKHCPAAWHARMAAQVAAVDRGQPAAQDAPDSTVS